MFVSPPCEERKPEEMGRCGSLILLVNDNTNDRSHDAREREYEEVSIHTSHGYIPSFDS